MAELKLDFGFDTKSLTNSLEEAQLELAASILNRLKDKVTFSNADESVNDLDVIKSAKIVDFGNGKVLHIELTI